MCRHNICIQLYSDSSLLNLFRFVDGKKKESSGSIAKGESGPWVKYKMI